MDEATMRPIIALSRALTFLVSAELHALGRSAATLKLLCATAATKRLVQAVTYSDCNGGAGARAS